MLRATRKLPSPNTAAVDSSTGDDDNDVEEVKDRKQPSLFSSNQTMNRYQNPTDNDGGNSSSSAPKSFEIGSSIEDTRSNNNSNSIMNFIQSKRGIVVIIASFILFLVAYSSSGEDVRSSLPSGFNTKGDGSLKKAHVFKQVSSKSTNNSNSNQSDKESTSSNSNQSKEELVSPIYGLASLTPNEFRDIRTAKSNESVLLTGGLGFIGSHVVDLLLHRGFSVTILDDESNGHNHNKYCTEMVPNDITIAGNLPKFPSEGGEMEMHFTHVIHLAAAISVAESMNDPDKYERINYGGSEKVLDWIREYNQHVSSLGDYNQSAPTFIHKVVAASSAAIYGDPDPALLPLQETAPYGGLSPYADTKFRMEGLMREFVKKQNDHNHENAASSIPSASATALRFFNVYGPRQDPKNPYSGVLSLFLDAAVNGKDITILGDGLMTRDFVYVKDVARAIVMALLQEKEAEDASFSVYNVCTGKSITINTLAEQVKHSTESSSNITHLDPRDGDIRESSCNPNGAKNGMGFIAAMSQEGGLKKTTDWFRSERELRLRR
jgi:UDP-glucose 4-epimerase